MTHENDNKDDRLNDKLITITLLGLPLYTGLPNN